jgi:thiol-disulfide isomerase/thioredoxin
MFKTKYFWRGYLLGIGIALVIIGFLAKSINTTRTAGNIKGFDEVSFVSLNGDTLNIKKAGSNPVFINYWGTHCAPCIKEMPLLLAFSKKYPKVKLWLLTIESNELIAKFITKHPEFKELNFAHLINKGQGMGVNNISAILPSTFLVKNDGTVIWDNDGMLPQETPEVLLDSIQKTVPDIKNLVTPN